jgi:hypothetical protein
VISRIQRSEPEVLSSAVVVGVNVAAAPAEPPRPETESPAVAAATATPIARHSRTLIERPFTPDTQRREPSG